MKLRIEAIVAIGLMVVIVGIVAVGCSSRPSSVQVVDELPPIYPDYIGVTVPADIAPLNFEMDGADRLDVTVHGSKAGELHVNGEWADFDIDEWHALTEQNRGGVLTVSVCAEADGQWRQYKDFTITVSADSLTDWGLTYRRITPGYEVGGNIGLYQRCIHTFEEYAIMQESAVPGRCFNCHTPNRTDPRWLTMQMRGEGGGTMVQVDGRQRWLNTKTDSTKAAGSYAYWHPSGNYCAYATNTVHQSFFVGKGQRIEAYHEFSNIVVLDVRKNELILSPKLMTTSHLEIFPAFSADGRYLYYSTSDSCRVPAEYEKVKCSLCRIPFDAAQGTFGEQVDTLLNGPATDKSYTLVRPSYDGRWLMYTMTSRSNFPVFQKDADLWLMNVETGETRALAEANSDDTDSYHNWSSDSRWFVFTSKREDGMYGRLYLAHVGADGTVSKPFLLPQRQPRKYYREMMDSYNVPDFTRTQVDFDVREAHRQVFANERIQVTIKK